MCFKCGIDRWIFEDKTDFTSSHLTPDIQEIINERTKSKIFWESIGRIRDHPKVHWPVSLKNRSKIKAFSVNAKERKQKWGRIISKIFDWDNCKDLWFILQ